MPVTKYALKTRRFKIWGVCVLLAAIGSVFVLVHLARRPSEPFISISLGRTNYFGTDIPAISMETTNRMWFNVDYLIVAEVDVTEVLHKHPADIGSIFGTYRANYSSSHSIPSHSKMLEVFIGPQGPPEAMRWSVSYERQLKPIEISVLSKLPWLKSRYPFYRRGSFIITNNVTKTLISEMNK